MVGDESWLEPATPTPAAAKGFAAAGSGFPLVLGGQAAPIWVDASEHAPVQRSVGDLVLDVERVTGARPEVQRRAERPATANLVIVGTLEKHTGIAELARAGRIDAEAIRGKWEAFLVQVVERPWPGVERALVIAGSDPRGAIYGVYELSQQIGVSPWHWWADVPVRKRPELTLRAMHHVDPGPVVRYRGIFLNDEAPALTGWAREKFGGFNHQFYARVFELMLRLRANYIWPAMWIPQAFLDDDPENARVARDYGIVLGTSHHEPLMRAHAEWGRYGQGPWDYAKNDEVLREFWRSGLARTIDKDKIVTLGMRGDGDEAMSEETNTALLERIVADQRRIIADVTGQPVEKTPQLWALYKEVQTYYERGMRVPDDVTLLWCDDNWGNIRRLPLPGERARPGGAGVYYHFDYVGGPRNYKWINVTPLPKIWEQMHLAWRCDATRIWIVNVGDLKPMEFPIEFFMNYAWNPARWPYEKLSDYSRAWTAREFGAAHAAEAADLIQNYAKLNRRRTPELLAPDTYSLVHDREAERVLADWRDLTARALRLEAQLPEEVRAAFFQLVRYPVQASANVHELYVAAGLNRLYARQGRVAANAQAARVQEAFDRDAALTREYHALNGGKWKHQMSQVKFGYTYWQTPPTDVRPATAAVRPNRGAEPALAIEGSETAWPVWGVPPPRLPPIDSLRRGSRWVELFNRGDAPFTFTASGSAPWIYATPASGTVREMMRVEVAVDWSRVPPGTDSATLTLTTNAGQTFRIAVPLTDLREKIPAGFGGFVETDGVVAVNAPNFARAVEDEGIEWKRLADFGRGEGGVTSFPVTAAESNPSGAAPRLEYDVWLTSSGDVSIEWQFAPSLDFQSGEGLRFAVSIDDEPPQVLRLGTWSSDATWEKSVADSTRRVVTKHTVARGGAHTVKFWRVLPGVVLERLIVNTGGMKPSYLGPRESPRAREPARKRVALVFDDGPDPANARPLLALLAREKVPVTFSLIGRNVAAHPDVARAMLEAGHEIANHSHTHAMPSDVDDAALAREVSEAQETIRRLTGFAPRWYWPPYLFVDERVRAAVGQVGLALYEPKHLVVSKDYDRSVSAEEIYRLATSDVRDGSVILFHEWRAETLAQLPAILAELRKQGCEFFTYSDLAKFTARSSP